MEINDYVRTKDGKIGKYIQPELGKPNITNGISFNEGANYGKHSKDITELLEVGDIIEFEVTDEDNYSHILGINVVRTETEEELIDIKDIVLNESAKIMNILTKEQFEANAYKIEKGEIE